MDKDFKQFIEKLGTKDVNKAAFYYMFFKGSDLSMEEWFKEKTTKKWVMDGIKAIFK